MKFVCHTDGSGYWSKASKAVTIEKLTIAYLNNNGTIDSTFGELRAYFDTETWDADTLGLIYTDINWLAEFTDKLVEFGFSREAADAVEYSEQGMQSARYVSMDITRDFIAEVDPMIRFHDGKHQLNIEIDLE